MTLCSKGQCVAWALLHSFFMYVTLAYIISFRRRTAPIMIISRLQQCFILLTDIYHSFPLLFLCCILLQMKVITINTVICANKCLLGNYNYFERIYLFRLPWVSLLFYSPYKQKMASLLIRFWSYLIKYLCTCILQSSTEGYSDNKVSCFQCDPLYLPRKHWNNPEHEVIGLSWNVGDQKSILTKLWRHVSQNHIKFYSISYVRRFGTFKTRSGATFTKLV